MDKGTIIFDFDGTIADSFDVVSEIFYELTGHGRITDPARIAELRKLPLKKVGKEIGISVRQVPFLLVKGRALMQQRMNEVKVFPGMQTTLKELHRSGWQLMVISTNSRQNVEAYLREHGMSEYFERVYGGVGLFGKTLALRKVLRQNKLKSHDCFYVGDEARDMQAAHRARIRAVAVTWGYNDVSILKTESPSALAEKPTDLVKIFAANEL